MSYKQVCNLCRQLFLLMTFVLLIESAFAFDEKYKAAPLYGSNSQIAKDSISTVIDTVVYNATLKPLTINYTVQNVVTFKIDEFSNIALPDSFQIRVKFQMEFTDYNGVVTYKTDSLTIDYDKNKTYTGKAVYLSTGGHKAVLKVLSVTTVYGNTSTFMPALMIENEIWVNRDYTFSCSNNVINSVYKDVSTVSVDGELLVYWNKERSASEYDLEWAYIDSTAIPNYYYDNTTTFNPSLIFDNNASRVTVKSEQYKIPLLYDNAGILFFRVRPVATRPSGQRIESAWSSDYIAQGGLGQYSFAGHERSLNWQATTSFAEDGKRKSVVQYFDGSLRGRQTVTKDNSTNTTVVAEVFYDYQGRPAIQVLPSPTLSSLIKFTPGFNESVDGSEYSKDRYDSIAGYNDYCSKGAAAMSPDTGSSKYYSPQNPFVNTSFNKYIPDAFGFPFTETIYTQDNTGRIAKQSGVGINHTIGSGHETKYFYGSADQEELDALFGTEVGNATHYFKNMVRDANGQYSVSYVDMHGRTIATALSGSAPVDAQLNRYLLDTLSSNVSRTITKKLLDSTNNDIKSNSLISSKTILVPFAGNHRFIYNLMPDSIKIGTCYGTSICYDCMYDLEIVISDECNNSFNSGQPITIRRSNVSLSPIDTSCNAPSAFPQVDTTIFLHEGSFTVTKTLTISQQALEKYRDSIFASKSICKTLDDFIIDKRNELMQTLQCYQTCKSCMDSLGTWGSYRQKFMDKLGISPADSANYRDQAWAAYEDQKDQCDQLCENKSLDKLIRQGMLTDVSPPFGQYADPDNVDNYSIFFKNNASGRYRFQTIDTVNNYFVDENGSRDYIILGDGITKVNPASSSVTPQLFADNFKSSWAKTLLVLHPEYCKLTEIEKPTFAPSFSWDERFEKTEDYQSARDSGYLNPTGLTGSSYAQYPIYSQGIDPFFASGGYGSSKKTDMQTKILHYSVIFSSGIDISIWSLASAMAHCKQDVEDTNCLSEYNSGVKKAFDTVVMCKGDLDMAWRYFREMYITEKRRIIADMLDNTCPWLWYINPKPKSPHTFNFIEPSDANALGSPTLSQANDSLNKHIDESCRGYVTQWLIDLEPCNNFLADTAVLIPRLIQVCKEGGDVNHPFGASSVRPSSTYRFKSFEDVLKQFADSTHKEYTTVKCNAYLITVPSPYEPLPSYATNEIWTKPDSCTCDKVNLFYSEYNSYKLSGENFSAYILRTKHFYISQGALDTLRNLCSDTLSCKYLDYPIVIPPQLQCNTGSECADCNKVQLVYQQYLSKFPGAVPKYNDTDSLQHTKNLLFESFMNKKLGFVKSFIDYLVFLDTCHIAHDDSTYCDSLKATLVNFLVKQKQASYESCDNTKWYDTKGFDLPNNILNFSDVISNGYAHLPATYTQQHSTAFDYMYDTLCVGDSFSVEIRLKHAFNNVDSDALGDDVTVGLIYDDAPGNIPQYVSIGFDQTDTVHSSFINLADTIIADTSLYANFNNWTTLKIAKAGTSYKVYVNGSLKKTITTTQVVHKLQRISTLFDDTYGYLDWVKIYNASNTLTFFEDFNSPTQFAKPDKSIICNDTTNCQSDFISFFNQSMGTSYARYSKIDSIYHDTCGITIGSCPTGDSCVNLQVTLEQYKQSGPCYNDELKYNTIIAGINHIPYTRSELIVSQAARLPIPSDVDSPRYYRAIEYVLGNSYINSPGGFTFSTRFKYVPSPKTGGKVFLAGGLGDNFYMWLDQLTPTNWALLYQVLYPGGGIQSYNFSSASGTLPIVADLNDGNYHQLRVEVTATQHRLYLDNTLWKIIPRNASYAVGNITKSIGFSGPISGVGSDSVETHIDYYKLQDFYGNNIYFEDFTSLCQMAKPDRRYMRPLSVGTDCMSCFLSFYNQQNNTSYTEQQVKTKYASCNIPLNICIPDSIKLCNDSSAIFPDALPNLYSQCDDSANFISVAATLRYNAYRDSLINGFTERYISKCLQAQRKESFTVTMPQNEYHYTLYYYDQAGNLVKTVPPKGVDVSKFGWLSNWSDSVKLSRKNNQFLVPAHNLGSQYRYNTLNQVVSEFTPDKRQTNFWYDRLGRLVVSQNAKQKSFNTSGESTRGYFYTRYDALGRVIESGQLKNQTTTPMTDAISRDSAQLNTWITNSNSGKGEVTRTFYDVANTGIQPTLYAANLRNRVTFVTYNHSTHVPVYNQTTNYTNATFYSYDIHGNVDTLIQDYGSTSVFVNVMNVGASGNRWKRMVYNYDLISGKVNKVQYQPGQKDAFYHKYEYDAENRLTNVYTSFDNVIWEQDARYDYYKHGPLARTVLGDQLVQGTDYVYTLQGWLKGVNSTSLLDSNDVGKDGKSGINQFVAKDALGFNLNYFDNDYSSINSSVNAFPNPTSGLSTKYRPLYNGNISSMAVNIAKLATPLQLYNYSYDQLNRLTGMTAYRGFTNSSNSWNLNLTDSVPYRERINYDANGNILNYLRNGQSGNTTMDSLSYIYYSGFNRLLGIRDQVNGSSTHFTNYSTDIDDQGIVGSVKNYNYDSIGNLIYDAKEGVSATWFSFGKINTITKSLGSVSSISYTYDAFGNRIGSKTTNTGGSSTVDYYNWYVRDAQGNVMAIYTSSGNGTITSSFPLTLSEQHLYGSNRLGILNRSVDMKSGAGSAVYTGFTRGNKYYELSNHLGNVLVTITDKKIGHDAGSGTFDYYDADVVTANDYYPFGMLMPGRTYSSGNGYRYGFNGKENDNDVKGAGNQQDYGMRIYDPRVGRFLSIDPLTKSYPWYTPYQFSGNKPIIATDLDGLEEEIKITSSVSKNKPSIQTQSAINLNDEVNAHVAAINYIVSRLEMDELKSAKEPENVLEWGRMGELTVSEKREVIENTVRQFIICVSSDRKITPSFNPSTVVETYTATYDFNYTLLGNKRKVDDIKSSIKAATTVIEFASTAREVTGKLPKFLDKMATPSSIIANALEGDKLGITKDIAKALYKKGLVELAKKVPSLSTAAGVLKGTPFTLTVQMAFSNSAPENDNAEIEEKRIEQLKIKTIAAMLFLFQNNNKPNKVIPLTGSQDRVSGDETRLPQPTVNPTRQ